jgi:hypothetical protein
MTDYKFIALIALVVIAGCLAIGAFEYYTIEDMKETCQQCIDNCKPVTEQEAYNQCRVCYMAPINGKYLEYKDACK